MAALLDRLYNFHWVMEAKAARSSQANFGGLKGLMQRHGLKAIVNLRGENSDLSWWRYEKRVCSDLGAAHLDAMLDSRHLPTRAMLERLMEAFETAPQPLLMKCSGGHDRTSFAAALFILQEKGWAAWDEAARQFDPAYGHAPKKHQFWLRPFLDFAATDAKGTPLADWVRRDYTPENLGAWLEAQNLGDSYKAIFTRPTRSPFQL